MFTVRRLGREDVDAMARLTADAFGGAERDTAFELARLASLHCAFARPELCWGAEVDGKLVGKWQLLDLTARVGRARLRVAGAHTVVVLPEHNGQGLVQAILEQGRTAVEELGFQVMLGFAQRGALYAALGGVPVAADYHVTVDAQKLPSLPYDPFREHTESDLPRIIGLYNASQAQRSLSLVRSIDQWPWLLRRPPMVWIADEGYLGVRDDDSSVELRELGGSEPEFVELALRKLGALARARGVREVRGHFPIDHPFTQACMAYGADVRIEVPKRSGCMGGIIQRDSLLTMLVPELTARLEAYDASQCVELTLPSEDLSQVFRCELGDGTPRPLTLRVPDGALLQLLFGYRSVRSVLGGLCYDEAYAEDSRRLLADSRALALLDSLFPSGHPFISHTDRW